jgi:hypothetical protein
LSLVFWSALRLPMIDFVDPSLNSGADWLPLVRSRSDHQRSIKKNYVILIYVKIR